MPCLTNHERAAVAAYLGFSNMRLSPHVSENDLAYMVQSAKRGAEEGIIALAQSYIESDEMEKAFRAEAGMWYDHLINYDWERILEVWSRSRTYLESIRRICETA